MDTDKDTPIKCPACGADNPRNRLTCQVCSEALSPGSPKRFSQAGEKKEEPPKELPKKTRKKKEVKTETTNETPPDMSKSNAPTKSRKPRKRRHPTDSTPQFFLLLEGGKLKAVKINWGVTVPLRRKDLPKDARNLLSLWNRNKDIIKNS